MAAANGRYGRPRPPDHIENINKWQLSERVKEVVQNTSLYRFASSISNCSLDSGLLSFLCESYEMDDSSFHIGQARLYLGLQDIFYLTGLPIDGEAVIANAREIHSECHRLLGIVPYDKSGFLKLNQLKTLEKVPDDCPNIEKYVRAYYLYILGCVVAPVPGGMCKVPAHYVRLLDDISRVDSYAWGSAMLAYIHAGLKKAKEKGLKNISGSGLVLQRLPDLAHHFSVMELPQSIPLVGGWTKLIAKKSKDYLNRIAMATLSNDDGQVMIKWQPYTRVQDVSDEMALQLKLCSAQVYLICMNNIWRYDFRQCVRQLGALLADTKERSLIQKKVKENRGKLKDWPTEHKVYVDEWNAIRVLLELAPPTGVGIASTEPGDLVEKEDLEDQLTIRELLRAKHNHEEIAMGVENESPLGVATAKHNEEVIMISETESSTSCQFQTPDSSISSAPTRPVRKRKFSSAAEGSSKATTRPFDGSSHKNTENVTFKDTFFRCISNIWTRFSR